MPNERTNDLRQYYAIVVTDAPCSHRLGWRTTATSPPQVITIRTYQVSTSPLADLAGVFALLYVHHSRVAKENNYIQIHVRSPVSDEPTSNWLAPGQFSRLK